MRHVSAEGSKRKGGRAKSRVNCETMSFSISLVSRSLISLAISLLSRSLISLAFSGYLDLPTVLFSISRRFSSRSLVGSRLGGSPRRFDHRRFDSRSLDSWRSRSLFSLDLSSPSRSPVISISPRSSSQRTAVLLSISRGLSCRRFSSPRFSSAVRVSAVRLSVFLLSISPRLVS